MHFDESSPIVQIILWLFVGGGGAKLYTAWRDYKSGKAKSELEKNQLLLSEKKEAEEARRCELESAKAEAEAEGKRADDEARKRRLVEEALADTRRVCIQQHGVEPSSLPPWPEYNRDPS